MALEGRKVLNQVGLLVTEELDIAILRCKAKVEKLAAECRRGNRRFRDIEFDLLDDQFSSLHSLEVKPDTTYTPADTLRVHQIFEEPQFFVGGATASDISQGSIGDCWFLSALAAVATADLIEKICVARDEKVGIYGFIFWRDGGWVDVIIDDLLCTKIPRWEDLAERERMIYKHDKDAYNRTARKGGKTLYFAKSGTENETWVPLIEKAYAKLHGDYGALEYGFTNEAIEDLTGGISTKIRVSDILDTDVYWKEELMRANADRLFACFISGDDKEFSPSANGLVSGHAYSIIRASEFMGKRFLRIRNPWGQYEWTGRWSDGSKEWSGEWLNALEGLDYKFGNDGEFVMEYSDFLETWDFVEKSRLFDSSWSLSQQWVKVDCGDFPKAWNYGDVTYTFTLSHASPTIIVLAQLDNRFFVELSGHYYWHIDFTLFKKGEAESIASSMHGAFWDRSVKLEVDLESGEYVVQVRIDRQKRREKEFSSVTNWAEAHRKYSRKRSEFLRSHSIAHNFQSSLYGSHFPLPVDIFKGQDLTELELHAYSQIREHKLRIKAAYEIEDPDTPINIGSSVDVPAVPIIGKAVGAKLAPAKSSKINQKNKTAAPEGPVPPFHPENKRGEHINNDDEIEDDDNDEDYVDEPSESDGGNTEASSQATESSEVPKTDDGDDSSTSTVAPPPPLTCAGCNDPIESVWFKCLHVTCSSFTLCEKCEGRKVHPQDHPLLKLETSDDRDMLDDNTSADDREGNSIVVGLRVYTNREAKINIKSQLRHGDLYRKWMTGSKSL